MEGSEEQEQPKNLPWLLLSDHYFVGKRSFRCILDFSTRQKRYVDLLETRGKTVCGTSSGWIIMTDDKTSTKITLVNPMTATKLDLPRISSLPACLSPFARLLKKQQISVHKAILSCDPNTHPNDYVVLAICGDSRKLKYHKAGQDSWTTLEEAGHFYDDIISDGEQLYAVNEWGRVVNLKFHSPTGIGGDSSPVVEEIAIPWFFRGDKVYLVIIDGELCLVLRYLRRDVEDGYATHAFEIYKYHSSEQEWEEVKTLDDGCIFLGLNHTVALSASSSTNFTANNIFFTDDAVENNKNGGICGRDVGQYLLKPGHRRTIHRPVDPAQLRQVWFMPSA